MQPCRMGSPGDKELYEHPVPMQGGHGLHKATPHKALLALCGIHRAVRTHQPWDGGTITSCARCMGPGRFGTLGPVEGTCYNPMKSPIFRRPPETSIFPHFSTPETGD